MWSIGLMATARARTTLSFAAGFSSAFKGRSRVQQHQLGYAALKGRMGGALHALALQTSAPQE